MENLSLMKNDGKFFKKFHSIYLKPYPESMQPSKNMSMGDARNIKLVIVGDGYVGKTCMLTR